MKIMLRSDILSKQIETLRLNPNINEYLNIPNFDISNLMSSRQLVFVKNRRRGYYIGCIKIYKNILNFIPEGILRLELSNIDFNSNELKYLPRTLKCLKINNTNGGIEKLIKNIILPEGLKELDLSNNRIVSLHGLKLSKKLKKLNLSSNHISNKGIKNFIFPISLEELILIDNRILDDEGLLLPPNLKLIDLSVNRIINDREFIYPPSIEKIIFNYTRYPNKYNMNRVDLVEKAKSEEGIKMYEPIYHLYTYRKKVLFTMCRGILYGETEVATFNFLKRIYGSRNIRQNILEFYREKQKI